MEKKLDPNFSETLETVFLVKNTEKFFVVDPDPGSGIFLTLDDRI